MIKAVIFDYGGVLAEEGFAEGLQAIAERNGLDPQEFLRTAADLIYETGYIVGRTDEKSYLNALRRATGIRESDAAIRDEIFPRFTLRQDVIGYVDTLRGDGLTTAILSDQTEWLDKLNARDHFFHHFDYVFNSFRIGKGKRDPSVFCDVCRKMGIHPGEAVFVDDNPGNVDRASGAGLHAILYKGLGKLNMEMKTYLA